jgi:hypothetical protein
MALPMTHGYGNPRKKVEVLTANYPIAVKPDSHAKKELLSKA